MVEEPLEPCDDLNADFLDTTNSNQDDFNATAEMEPAPVAPQPYRAAVLKGDFTKMWVQKFVDQKKLYGAIIVHTEAVDLEAICNAYQGCILNERLLLHRLIDYIFV